MKVMAKARVRVTVRVMPTVRARLGPTPSYARIGTVYMKQTPPRRLSKTALTRQHQHHTAYVCSSRLTGEGRRPRRPRMCTATRTRIHRGSRIVQSVVYGCIPIVVQDFMAQPFHEYLPYSSFSLHVDESEIDVLPEILRAIPASRVREMQASPTPTIVWLSKLRTSSTCGVTRAE